MPYVPVPKDLTKVKTKLAFNLTKRQLICFSLAGLVGLPVYFFTRGAIGNSAAVLLMIGLMMPFFFFAMYERTVHFITPYIPTGCLLSCKQFHSGLIAHEFYDLIPHLVRFLAVLLNMPERKG